MRFVEFILIGLDPRRVMIETTSITAIAVRSNDITEIYTTTTTHPWVVEGSYEEVIRKIAEGQRLTNLVKYGIAGEE